MKLISKSNILIILLTLFLSVGIVNVVVQANQVNSAQEFGITEFDQSPVLEEKIEEGALPPLEERLPADPVVVKPVEEVGTYGGEWNRVHLEEEMGFWTQVNHYEPFLRWNREANDFIPNLVKDWDWNEDYTEITLHFVEGIKWSDGEPFTVDDFIFYWEDMVLDDQLPQSPLPGQHIEGKPMEVTKIDDYTLKCKFSDTNPLFLGYMSRGTYTSAANIVPSHYLKQYHPKYNSDLGEEEVQDLIDRYDFRHQYPDMPTIYPWKTVEWDPGNKAVLERNPYYWKVDTEGNQLPYIDKVVSRRIEDEEMLIVSTLEEEIDAQFRDYPIPDIPMLTEESQNKNFRIVHWERGDFAWPWLIPGFNHPEEKIRDIMYNQKFRKALSVAIDRSRINELVHLGLGEPRQAALSPRTPSLQTSEGQKVFEEWANLAAEFDPERAKKLLDEIGMTDETGDDFRELPNGDEFNLVVDVVSADNRSIDAMDFIKENWENIGIKTTINPMPGSAIATHRENGEYMMTAWGSAAAWDIYSAPAVWAPIQHLSYSIAPQCSLYLETGGEQGMKPREVMKNLQDKYNQIVTTPDKEERRELLLEAYQIHIDEGPLTIGTVAANPSPIVLKENFRNVPEVGILGPWDLGFPGTANPEQFYFKE